MISNLKEISDKIPWPLVVIGSVILFLSSLYFSDAPERESTLSATAIAELNVVREFLDEPDSEKRKRNISLLRFYLPNLDESTLNSLLNDVDNDNLVVKTEEAYNQITKLIELELVRIESSIKQKKYSLSQGRELSANLDDKDEQLMNANLAMIEKQISDFEDDLKVLGNIYKKFSGK